MGDLGDDGDLDTLAGLLLAPAAASCAAAPPAALLDVAPCLLGLLLALLRLCAGVAASPRPGADTVAMEVARADGGRGAGERARRAALAGAGDSVLWAEVAMKEEACSCRRPSTWECFACRAIPVAVAPRLSVSEGEAPACRRAFTTLS